MTDRTYRIREGLQPLPHIGPGPLAEAEYLAREARYMAQFEAGASNPRESGIYVSEGGVELPQPLPQGEVLPEPDLDPEHDEPEDDDKPRTSARRSK